MTHRLFQLFWGLCLYGFSMALMLRANLGLDPWDVLHQGIAPSLGLSFGMTVNLVGLVVLLLWIPLRQRPGVGTVLNIVVIGTAVDLSLLILPTPEGYAARFAFLIGGIVLNGIAGGAYIGAGLGPGPRDGLMTGLCARTGWPVKIVRTAIELAVLTIWMDAGRNRRCGHRPLCNQHRVGGAPCPPRPSDQAAQRACRPLIALLM